MDCKIDMKEVYFVYGKSTSTVQVLSIHEIITPENYKFFKGVVLWIRSQHQVRAEHWTKIMDNA